MSDKQCEFPELLKGGRIGKLEIKNRIAMAPMGTYLAARDGTVPDRMMRYYEERARGGAGLIIIEIAAVDHPRGRGMTRQIGISEDKFIAGLSELAKAIHKHGAKAGIQLHHGGRIAAPFLSGGFEAVAPSAIPLIPQELGMAREMSIQEISQMVQSYASAALRAKRAGIDGVEIHAGHGYLIDQFLSRSSNHRQDSYGGSLENRARFLLEIVAAVRKAVGSEYPVWCRIDGREYAIENGITAEESQEIARKLEAAGVDALSVSGYGGSAGVHFTNAPLVYTPCYLMPEIRNIKRAVKIPVIAAGRIDLEHAGKILRQGDADFIAMGRPLLADPELPNKVASGQHRDIRKCIYCYTCVHQIFVRNSVCCAINPAVGKESDPPPVPPQAKKKVLVAGGGPAGMTAAISAAERGHDVTLIEKELHLGGSLTFASIIRPENKDLMGYLVDRVGKLGVDVRLGAAFDVGLVEKMQPDTVVIATGCVRHNPAIPGIEDRRVIDGNMLRKMLNGQLTPDVSARFSFLQRIVMLSAVRLLKPVWNPASIRHMTRLWMPVGKRVTVIGAGMIGCELAVFLAERGRKVTVVETSDQIAPEMPVPMKWRTVASMERLGVGVLGGVKLVEVNSAGLVVMTKDGTTKTCPSDSIIVATGAEPDSSLAEKLRGKAREILVAGDCGKMSFIKGAVSDGTAAGSAI